MLKEVSYPMSEKSFHFFNFLMLHVEYETKIKILKIKSDTFGYFMQETYVINNLKVGLNMI